MNTSTEVIKQLQEAIAKTQSSQTTVDDLIAAHDYQDVTSLVIQSAEALLHAATALMQEQDENALDLVESAEDLLEAMYNIIDGEVED